MPISGCSDYMPQAKEILYFIFNHSLFLKEVSASVVLYQNNFVVKLYFLLANV